MCSAVPGSRPGVARGSKVKCRHGSRARVRKGKRGGCRVGLWGMGNQCDSSAEQALERRARDSNTLALFFTLSRAVFFGSSITHTHTQTHTHSLALPHSTHPGTHTHFVSQAPHLNSVINANIKGRTMAAALIITSVNIIVVPPPPR